MYEHIYAIKLTKNLSLKKALLEYFSLLMDKRIQSFKNVLGSDFDIPKINFAIIKITFI